MLVSTNGGETWITRPLPSRDMFAHFLEVHPQDPSVIYTFMGNWDDLTLLKTMDGGVSWTAFSYGNSIVFTYAMKIDSRNPNIMYAATYLGVYKSTDGGGSWTLRGFPGEPEAFAIDPINPGTIYAGAVSPGCCYTGVYKSTDDGVTWSAFSNGLRTNVRVNHLEFDRSGRFLHAATPAGVFSVRVREGAVAYEGDVAPRNGGDGVVNALDVVQMRRFATGLDTPDPASNEFQRADCSPRATFGDGVIDATDVLQARRYAAGLDPLTPAGGPAVAADYHEDSYADRAVYRDGQRHPDRSAQGYSIANFGLATDKPVPADYDGYGETDPAVYRDGIWYLLQSLNGITAFQFGIGSDIPVPADYDGDGKADAAVYRNDQ